MQNFHPSIWKNLFPYLQNHILWIGLMTLIKNPEKSANLDGAPEFQEELLLEGPLSQHVGATGTVLGGHGVES